MSETNIIYLDNASTTKTDPEVLNKYLEVSTFYFANTSSIHIEGQKSFNLLEKARKQILNIMGLEASHDLLFTSGATEANNLAIKGVAFQYRNRGNHIITSIIEHPSVLEPIRQLEKDFGFEVTYLPVNEQGKINIDDLKAAIRKETILVSIMSVNNELGSINDIEGIGRLLKQYPKIIFHSDITQSIGKIDKNYKDVDLLSFSAHKIHGVHGSGALIKNKNINLYPLHAGGGQENNLRSGTLDLPASVALAVAIRKSYQGLKVNFDKIKDFYNTFLAYFTNHPEDYEINTLETNNPYIINVSLKNKKASVVVEALSRRGIMISSTSACHSKKEVGSYVVKALGKSEKYYSNTLRFSFSDDNTKEDILKCIECLEEIIKEVKNR